MRRIDNLDALHALYDKPNPRSLTKVVDHVTPLYRQWIEAARFTVIASTGPEGVDASPRGDDGPVVRVADAKTVLLPDWRGNNRLDTLRNIVRDGRVSLMFMVAGSNNVVRINGQAVITDDAALCQSFAKGDLAPTTVIVITVGEVYFQCAKALMRSHLWLGEDASSDLPKAGAFLQERETGFDGAAYDAGYADYAKTRMW